MKLAKASQAEIDTLMKWLQDHETEKNPPPPFLRVVFGYETLVQNVCDPAKDYLDYKPGTSPAEIAALRGHLDAIGNSAGFPEVADKAQLADTIIKRLVRLGAENAKLREAGNRLAALFAIPDRSDGHVWPDLNDEIRPALDAWTEAKLR